MTSIADIICRQNIYFPELDSDLSQDEEYFFLEGPEKTRKIRFHDYGKIYKVPGLYEEIFYKKLKCTSPGVVVDLLIESLNKNGCEIENLNFLDFGAGNGIVGETLKFSEIGGVVGADILPEARDAALRDRPGVYDDYYVEDFCSLSLEASLELESCEFDGLITVAALGFGDIPTEAFINAFNLVKNNGYIAFNIKLDFLEMEDRTGFSRLIRDFISDKIVNIIDRKQYTHRLSFNQKPLEYVAVVVQKKCSYHLSTAMF